MEEPSHSSMGKSHGSKEVTPHSEESGWTSYLEDFLVSQKKEGSTSSVFSPSIGAGSSMVSDAASYVAWKPSAHAKPSKGCKKLSLKKRKAKVTLDDDTLEDTASSINSPKVSDLNSLGVDLRKEEDDTKISPTKSPGSANCGEPRGEEIDEMSFRERKSDVSELRKRGLCLVPLSMLLDYLKPCNI